MSKSKHRVRHSQGPKLEFRMVDRPEAVALIGAAYADRSDYIVAGPPSHAAGVLAHLPQARCIADSGDELVAVLAGPGRDLSTILLTMSMLTPLAVVILIPKSTAYAAMEAAGLGSMAKTGRDVCMASSDGRLVWPLVLVDGIDISDPLAAAQIRAQGAPA